MNSSLSSQTSAHESSNLIKGNELPCGWQLYTRPFDLEEGNDACLLPCQREDIREKCGKISASVRSRSAFPDTKKLTLTGPPSSDFVLAKALAEKAIAENFAKNIKCLKDVPGFIRDVPKDSKMHKKPALFADYQFDGKPSQADYGPGFTVHNSKDNWFYPTREAPAAAAYSQQVAQQRLIAPPLSSSMVAQMVGQQQQLVYQQQQFLLQNPHHPQAVQIQQNSMAMMTMMMTTLTQGNSSQGHVVGQPMTITYMPAANIEPMQYQPMGYPESTPLLRPDGRGNKGIIGIHMKQIILNEEY